MKKLLLVIMLFGSLVCSSQEPATGIFPLKDSLIYYEKIVLADSVSKEQIYRAIKSWGVSAFKSQKDVLQADDKETGILAYKYFFTKYFTPPPISGVTATGEWNYWCVLRILIKDGKAKIVIEDLNLIPRVDGASSDNISILNIKRDTEASFEKTAKDYGKAYVKTRKKFMGEEYMKKYYEQTRLNFIEAHNEILATIESLEKIIKSGKNEFDF